MANTVAPTRQLSQLNIEPFEQLLLNKILFLSKFLLQIKIKFTQSISNALHLLLFSSRVVYIHEQIVKKT